MSNLTLELRCEDEELYGRMAVIDYDFSPAEGDGWHSERFEASVSLNSVEVDKVDVIDRHTDDELYELRERTLRAHLEKLQEDATEAAIQKYEDRLADRDFY